MTDSGQSNIAGGVRMPELLYDHLRELAGRQVDDQAVILAADCERCAAIRRWAREGREVER